MRLIAYTGLRCATPLWPYSRSVHRSKHKIGADNFQTDSFTSRQMSTPPGRTPAPRDPFKLLSAILTGLVLGFFAVMLFQQDLPQQSPRQMLAQASAAAQPPLAKGAVLPPAPAVKAATPVKQAEPEPSPAKPAEMAQTPDRRPAPEDVKAPSKVSGEAAAPAAPEPAKASAAEVPVPAKPAPSCPGPCLDSGLLCPARKIPFLPMR